MESRRLSRNILSAGALILAVILFMATNIVVNATLKSARIDLTENRLYTLSDGTKSLLRSLRDPITLRFYYTERLGAALPQYTAYANQVRDLLEEYVTASEGRVRLEVYDPLPFTDVEDRAVAYGLQGVPVDQGDDKL